MKLTLYATGTRRRKLGVFRAPISRFLVTPRRQLAVLAEIGLRRENDLLDVLNRLIVWKPRGRNQEEQKAEAVKTIQEVRKGIGFTGNALINLAKRLPRDLPLVPSPEPDVPPEDITEEGMPNFLKLRFRASEIADQEPRPIDG